MSAPARIGAFAALVVAVFGAATLLGGWLDPDVAVTGSPHEEGADDMETHAAPRHAGGDGAAPLGLAVAHDGYRLVPDHASLPSEQATGYRFRIVGPDGEVVRDFDLEHERRMHLIVVGRDFTAFQHLHPRQEDDGTWVTDVDLSRPGAYRVFADFSAAGRPTTLSTDLLVPGSYEPRPLPGPSTVGRAGGGYEVSLESEDPRPGAATLLRFTVTRDGEPVGAVQPYLGADGHLVALREHDQAYLHTHPEGDPGGREIAFAVEYPSAGRYRLFLQFRHRGEVRTAEFTQEVGDDQGTGAAERERPRAGAAPGDAGHDRPAPGNHHEQRHGH